MKMSQFLFTTGGRYEGMPLMGVSENVVTRRLQQREGFPSLNIKKCKKRMAANQE